MLVASKFQLFSVGVLVWLSGFANAKVVHRLIETSSVTSSAVVTGNGTTTIDSTGNVRSTEHPSEPTIAIANHARTPHAHRPKVTTTPHGAFSDISNTTTSVVVPATPTSIITGPPSLLPPTLVIPPTSHLSTTVVYTTSTSLPSPSDVSSSAVRSSQHRLGATHLGLIVMCVAAGVFLL
jgi:cytoskeletal protein RodZ